MKRRVPFDGTNQKRALYALLAWSERSLRTKSGKTLKDLANELSMAPATLARYLNGTTPLSSEQFEGFAMAFETTEAALIAACFPVMTGDDIDGHDPTWDFRAELHRAWPHDAAFVDLTYQEHVNEPQFAQRVVVDALRRLAARDQDMLIQESGHAVADDRSQARFMRTG